MEFLYLVVAFIVFQCLGSLKADFFDNEVDTHSKKTSGDNSVEEGFMNGIIEPSPCQMVTTKYGCCWDQKTLALGPNGKGCPVCKDHRHMKCKKWKKYCNESKAVRDNCPMSCGVCGQKKQLADSLKSCKDHPTWKAHCSIYKQLNFCRIPEIADECKLTCGKCGSS